MASADMCPDAPDPWLLSFAPLFSTKLGGTVLDVACGAGRNALWLARLGVRVHGFDASPELVQRAQQAADRDRLPATFDQRQVPPQRPPKGPWDAILVFHYLDRSLFDPLMENLSPGGWLLYKTHLNHLARPAHWRPRNPNYLLGSGELLRAFAALQVFAYREWLGANEAHAGLVARRCQITLGRPRPGSAHV